MPKQKNTEEFIKEVKDLVGDEYTVLGKYVNGKTKIKMRHNCKKCNNYEYEVRPSDFVKKNKPNRCPKCNGNIKRTTDEFKNIVKNIDPSYEVIGSYKNCHTKIKMKHNCLDCNNYEFEMQPNDFIQGHRCPKCAGLETKTHEEFIQEVKDLVGDEYDILDKYTNNKANIRIRHNCNLCNNYEFEMRPNNFLRGQRCPKCNDFKEVSNGEIELLNFLESLNLDIKKSDRTILNGKEIDILINNVGIEFDGLYWHSEVNGKDKNYHLNKTNECNKNGIRLIHVFEDEWEYKKDIVKSKILNIIHHPINIKKVYARKCEIKLISTKMKDDFLNRNHIQGTDKSLIKLGLFYENNLVSVMTFCKPRASLNTDKTYDYELSRFASDITCNVVGGFSKLFSYFKKNYDWNKIITFADKRWSVGNVYIKNGWTHVRDSKPNYWYCKQKTREHRYKFRKSELKKLFPNEYNDNYTEFEIMNKTNYFRIWDCGNMVFEYNRDMD